MICVVDLVVTLLDGHFSDSNSHTSIYFLLVPIVAFFFYLGHCRSHIYFSPRPFLFPNPLNIKAFLKMHTDVHPSISVIHTYSLYFPSQICIHISTLPFSRFCFSGSGPWPARPSLSVCLPLPCAFWGNAAGHSPRHYRPLFIDCPFG